MAEISSLLGLITDDNTRQALIAQMENMFDNAPDEERLIQEIGNPTKVAVALIRYADSGKITPAAAPVVAPEQVQPIMENLSSKGLYLITNANSREEADALMKNIAKWTHD